MDYTSPYFINNEDIYEITVGIDPKSDMRFTVSHRYMRNTPNEVEVTSIEHDRNYLESHGISRFLVFGENKEGETKLWKTLENQPVTVTCKL